MKVSKTTILSGIACLGVVGTGVAGFFAGRKSSKYLDDESLTRQEKLKRVLLYNIPSFITGGGTIFLIAMSNKLSLKTEKRLTAALVTSAELANMSLDELKSKCSEKEYKEIVDELNSKLIDIQKNDHKRIWKLSDDLGGDVFEASFGEVVFATLHVLEHFCQYGDVSVNVLRLALGLDWDPQYEDIGWNCNAGLYTVPFHFGEFDSKVFDGTEAPNIEAGGHYTPLDPIYSPEDLTQYDL